MADSTIVEATRIAAGDDRTHYDRVSIGFHWATALIIVVMWSLAQLWDYAPKGPTRSFMQSSHVSLGLLLTAIILSRIVWRLGPGIKLELARKGWVETAASGLHYVLYALIATEIALGWNWRWAQGRPLSFFGLFALPSPFTFTPDQRHTLGDLHGLGGNIIMGAAALHAAAALFHHYALHDDVLWRMLPGRQARRRAEASPDPRSV